MELDLSSGNRERGHGSWGLKKMLRVSKERGWLTSALHSGSLACRPGISLMAEDKLSLHEVTLL